MAALGNRFNPASGQDTLCVTKVHPGVSGSTLSKGDVLVVAEWDRATRSPPGLCQQSGAISISRLSPGVWDLGPLRLQRACTAT